MKILLFLIPVLALARPTPEIVKADALNPTLRAWRRVQALNWRYVNDSAIAGQYQPTDVAMWEPYTGQPIAAGDLFFADYPDKKLFNQFREAKAVTATTITTVLGTTISLSQVRGIVRRVVRVVP
jgi:hypothetical protein